MTVSVYRGEPRSKGGMMAHGVGRYYALVKDDAETFVKPGTIQKSHETLKNPAIFTSDDDLKQTKEAIEEEIGVDLGKSGNLYEMLRNDQAPIFTAWLQSHGIDGIIVTYKESAGGRQLVKFAPREDVLAMIPDERLRRSLIRNRMDQYQRRSVPDLYCQYCGRPSQGR